MKKTVSAITLLVFLAMMGCAPVITPPVIFSQKSPKQIANKVCLAILLSDMAKEDSGFKEKAASVVSQLSKHLSALKDGKFTLDEAFKQIRTAMSNGIPLVDQKIAVIVQLAFEDEMDGYLEIPDNQNEKLQKLIEIIQIVNRKLKKIGGN